MYWACVVVCYILWHQITWNLQAFAIKLIMVTAMQLCCVPSVWYVGTKDFRCIISLHVQDLCCWVCSILGNSHSLKVIIHSLWFDNPLWCVATSWTNQVGYIIQHNSHGVWHRSLGQLIRKYNTYTMHGCPYLSSVTMPSPLALRVVIEDKSWLPWYNCY